MDRQWSTFFEYFNKDESPYGRVNPHHALIVVEKLREGLKRPLLMKFNRSAAEKENIKILETVSKDLRNLISETS